MAINAVKINPELYWKLLNKEFVEISGCKTIYTGIPSPWLNGVMGGTPKDINAPLRYFAEKNIPFCWWGTDVTKIPPGLDYFGKSQGMQCNLTTLKAPSRSDLQITCVSDTETLIEFLEVLMQAYSAPHEILDPLLKLFLEAGFTHPRLHFIGKVDGKAVSVCSIYIDNDKVASLFNVGTPEIYRGKGYASNLVGAALSHVQQLEVHYAALTAFPEAINLYTRLGFAQTHSFDIFIKN